MLGRVELIHIELVYIFVSMKMKIYNYVFCIRFVSAYSYETNSLMKAKHMSLMLRWSLLDIARSDLAATAHPLPPLTRGVMDTAARQVGHAYWYWVYVCLVLL